MGLRDDMWWTRKARIRTEQRLINNALHSELVLVWYSLASVSSAIYYMSQEQSDQTSQLTWISFSILMISASGFLAGQNYRKRAEQVKRCYENIKTVLYELKQPDSNEVDISERYRLILDTCENHIDADYYSALCLEYRNKNDNNELTKLPTKYVWLNYYSKTLFRLLAIAVFYLLPLVIFCSLEKWS